MEAQIVKELCIVSWGCCNKALDIEYRQATGVYCILSPEAWNENISRQIMLSVFDCRRKFFFVLSSDV